MKFTVVRIRFFLLILLLVGTGWTTFAQAQAPTPTSALQQGFNIVDSIRTSSNITAPAGGITGTILSVLRFVLSLAAVVALVVLVIGGLMYILSFGDEDASKRAKRLIFNTIIGLIIIGASVLIVNGIIAFIFQANA